MIDFTLTIEGLNPLTQFLNKELPNRIDAESKKILKQIGEKVAKRAQALAPRLSGALERSIRFRLGKIQGGQEVVIYVSPGSKAAAYAEYMHEGYYTLGSLSRMKPGAGRKYIERAIKENKASVTKMYNEMLAKVGKEETPPEGR